MPPGRATASVRDATPVSPEDLAGAIVVDPSAARSRVYQFGTTSPDGASQWRDDLRAAADDLASVDLWLADEPRPAEPPQPHEPPSPPEPPEPVEPPEPREPPRPPEPHEPPVPVPVPPPVPPQPTPVPPFPHPPGPEPVPPQPPVPPGPPPSPFPAPPGPVPPPPVIGRPLTGQPLTGPPLIGQPGGDAMGQPDPPGVYRSGLYVRPDWRTTLAPDPIMSGPPGAGPAGAEPGLGPGGVVPGARPGGNVYGGQTGLPTSANAEAPLELSGSLTGLILARGRPAQLEPGEQRSRTRRVVGILATVLVIVVAMGAMIAFFAGDIISALIEGAFNSD
jgi:hypothetical protein